MESSGTVRRRTRERLPSFIPFLIFIDSTDEDQVRDSQFLANSMTLTFVLCIGLVKKQISLTCSQSQKPSADTKSHESYKR